MISPYLQGLWRQWKQFVVWFQTLPRQQQLRGLVGAGVLLLLVVALIWLVAERFTRGPVDVGAEETVLFLKPARFDDLPGWKEDDFSGLAEAWRRSCAIMALRDPDKLVGPDGIAGTVRDWQHPCVLLAELDSTKPAAMRALLQNWFRPWQLTGQNGDFGLFTGYYEPIMAGRLDPGSGLTPIYLRPPELVMVDLGAFRDKLKGRRIAGTVVDGRLKPFHSRADIVAGALDGAGLELAWLDPVDAFFLQIQGSGRIDLPDDSVLRVGYDGQNGHPYFAIGRELIQREVLTRKNVSLQTIRDWLYANPDEADAVMNLNASYVFFRALSDEGAIGSAGVPLTPERSLAVDRSLLPMDVPVWLDIDDPRNPETRWQRLLMAQDTGGAIRGAVRGDVFWGAGEVAERVAGGMKSQGRAWLLLPNLVTPPATLLAGRHFAKAALP